MYVYERWKDFRLNLTSFQQQENPVFPTYYASDIWVPNIVFDNCKDGKLFHLSVPNTYIQVTKEGEFRKSTR